jgi:RNA polymerase sigma-70 factor (ECF subfamily)
MANVESWHPGRPVAAGDVVGTGPAAKRGDSAAPAEQSDAALVRQHARGVVRFVRLLGADAALAEDLAQESFVIAWRKRKQHLPATALGAFLRQAARRLWLERRRGDRRHDAALANAAEQLWARECAHDDGEGLVAAARMCLHRLGERARTAVQLVYMNECDRAEVALQLGLRDNGLKMLLQRARAALAECIRNHQGTGEEP